MKKVKKIKCYESLDAINGSRRCVRNENEIIKYGIV